VYPYVVLSLFTIPFYRQVINVGFWMNQLPALIASIINGDDAFASYTGYSQRGPQRDAGVA